MEADEGQGKGNGLDALVCVPMALSPFCSTDADWPGDIVFVVFVGLRDGRTIRPTERRLRVVGTLEVGSKVDEETGAAAAVAPAARVALALAVRAALVTLAWRFARRPPPGAIGDNYLGFRIVIVGTTPEYVALIPPASSGEPARLADGRVFASTFTDRVILTTIESVALGREPAPFDAIQGEESAEDGESAKTLPPAGGDVTAVPVSAGDLGGGFIASTRRSIPVRRRRRSAPPRCLRD